MRSEVHGQTWARNGMSLRDPWGVVHIVDYDEIDEHVRTYCGTNWSSHYAYDVRNHEPYDFPTCIRCIAWRLTEEADWMADDQGG